MNAVRRALYPLAWRLLSSLGISKVDYRRHYRRKDLNHRYKILAGSPSEAMFDRTGDETFVRLKSLGLKPNSTILDVGCGPGRVASRLIEFLNDDGSYYGCDISPDVIGFCGSRYSRVNFHFLKNEMTKISLPLSKYFDFLLCFSVFTHVYPDEMQALLRECGSLIKDGGVMIATFIIAGRKGSWLKSVKTFFGNRDRIEYNEEYLSTTLDELGIDMKETEPIGTAAYYILRFR